MRRLAALVGLVGAVTVLTAPAAARAEETLPLPPAVTAPAPGAPAAPAAPAGTPAMDVALSQSAAGRRIPWDRLDAPDYLLVRDVISGAAVAQEVRDIAFRSRRAVFDFLLAHPDFAADVARMLREGKYRLRRVGDAYEADDGRGVHGILRIVMAEGGQRVFYLSGTYDTPLLPTLSGRVVLVLDAEHVDGPDGVTYCDMRVSGFLKLDQALPAAMARVAQTFSEAQVDRRVRRFFRHVARVSGRAHDDPEGLADQVAGQPGLDPAQVDAFRAVLLAHRPPPWAETVPYRLLEDDGPRGAPAGDAR